MSRQSYINGFRKAAAARNVDPENLAKFAEYVMSKEAADGEVMMKIRDLLGKATNYYKGMPEWGKGLVGAGAGAALGTGLGAALSGKKGLRTGAILGAIGGGAGAVDWTKVRAAIDAMEKEHLAKNKAKSDAKKPESSDIGYIPHETPEEGTY